MLLDSKIQEREPELFPSALKIYIISGSIS